jgi:hypothetical protein
MNLFKFTTCFHPNQDVNILNSYLELFQLIIIFIRSKTINRLKTNTWNSNILPPQC